MFQVLYKQIGLCPRKQITGSHLTAVVWNVAFATSLCFQFGIILQWAKWSAFQFANWSFKARYVTVEFFFACCKKKIYISVGPQCCGTLVHTSLAFRGGVQFQDPPPPKEKNYLFFLVFPETFDARCFILLSAPCKLCNMDSKNCWSRRTISMLLSKEGSEWPIFSLGATSRICKNRPVRNLEKGGMSV